MRNKQVEFNPYTMYLYFNYFIKIVPFWLRNIRFLIQNTRSLFYGRHYSWLHRLMSLQRKLNVKIFLMFIVAENTGSVNITKLHEDCFRAIGYGLVYTPPPQRSWGYNGITLSVRLSVCLSVNALSGIYKSARLGKMILDS